MTVNPGVARFEHFAHETVAQIRDTLRTFQRVVGPACRIHLTFLIEATWQRVDFLRSQGKPLLRALRQRLDEALSAQSHLRLAARWVRDGLYAILLNSEPFLNRIRHLYGTPSRSKTIPTLIVAAFAGLAVIILMLFKMSASNQAGNEHAGTVEGDASSLTQVPDWTIFDDIVAKDSTRLAAPEIVDPVRISGGALGPDAAETFGQVMREAVPLPRPRPKHR
jgi:hypothetical protein